MAARNPSTFVISLTCYNDAATFDPVAQRSHFKRMAAAGIGVYAGGGGSGEAYTLTPTEYRQLMQIAREELKGKVPVRIMGVEPRSAEQMVELYRLVKPYDLDAMQIYSLDQGHGEHPNPRELETYFRDILTEVKMPCVLSSHMSVGYFIPIPLIKSLANDYPHVIGINATNPDVRYITELRDTLGDRVEIHVGGPMQGLTALSLGCQGFLTSEGNLVPRLCVAVIDAYKKGDMEETFNTYDMLLRVFQENTKHGSIRGIKAALAILGLPGGYPRKPRLPVTDEQRQDIARWVRDLDIQRWA